jgi:hypothetical protein
MHLPRCASSSLQQQQLACVRVLLLLAATHTDA